ncbi:hypothetical protein Q4601_15385 [Shewanella sp. 1_MG-2023]|uniref:hypothetical protein n=1 Tax=unclassified Shewanella TaxID=196818 RepID=UPI0026E46CFC|nr:MULTISPECIES: hypothetical protein [unclassified Shewanella]MDO6613102.1 hypothetical protein [Shewanella sp. 7_MG-2023]MDO6772970.1 hypothetical protein [Shewanella sp. 2_MG-2023]MDO6795690.1 hypothetical protein [Shewanella sp. 1_MG-2023]
MTQQESLSALSRSTELIKSDTIIQSQSSSDSDTFADILTSVSKVKSVGSAVLDSSSTSEIFSVDSLQQQILAETGLGNSSILSLNMNSSMITELQQGLLSSLQTSMLKTAVTNAVGENTLVSAKVSSEEVSSLKSNATPEESNIGEDIYKFSFGEDGFDQKDVIDSVNILNHTPILSYIYQETTDTEISPASTLAGSLIYSDYVGAGSTAIKLIMDYFTETNAGGIAAGVSSFLSDDNDKGA